MSLCFALFDGFSNMVLASAIEPLRAACDLSGRRNFTWKLATLDGQPALSSSRISINVDGPLAGAGDVDVLILLAGYGVRQHATPQAAAEVHQAARRARMLGGYDTGSWMLANAGLLSGRPATIHWLEQDAFREKFLDVRLVVDKFVIDGNRLTAGGAAGVMALTLHLIGRQAGEALVFDVAEMFAHGIEPQRWRALDPEPVAPLNHSYSLRRAIVEMRRSVEDPLPLRAVADAAAVSERTLNRLFQTELGMSAGKYYQTVRLSLAMALAQETRMPLTEIAARTGFASPATLSRAFSVHFGSTIGSARSQQVPGDRAGL